jgi:hypothetical protein
MQSIVDYRNQYLPDVEVWITEFGWDSGINDTPFSCPSIGSYSREEVQAMWIAREYLLLASTGIDRAAQFMLRNVDNDGKTQFETCGLVNEKFDWSPKPSWYYTYTMKNTLKGLYYTGEQNSYNSNVLIYKFESALQDTMVYAVWAPTSNGTIIDSYQLSLPDKPATATLIELVEGEIQGLKTGLRINRNTVSITVSEKPVFVMTSQVVTGVPHENTASSSDRLVLYPNPVQYRLIMKIPSADFNPGPVEIYIRNPYGQIIKQEKLYQTEGMSELNTDVSSLAEGTYFIELITSTRTFVNQFIKMK